jgi:UDP-glucose 4-epimerase
VTFDQVRIHNVVATWDESGQFAQWLPRCGAVVHAASSSTPGASMAAPQIDGNLRTTLALIEALQRYYETRLLYLSSAGTLYGERDVPAIESSPLRPRSYHGAGKAAAEQFIHAWAMQYQGTAFVIRPSNVYGPGQTARHGFAIVPTAMDHAVSGAPLEIWGDGTQLRDYLYVDDLMSLCMKVIDARVPDGCHIFNAASGNAITLNDLVERIEVVSGRAIPRMHAPARAADVGKVLVSAETARIVFGWVADISLDEGLMRTWAWYQSNT